jgi:hypothetical protein
MSKRYFGVRIIRAKKNHTVYVHADEIRVENGDLLLIEKRDEKEVPYRAFARGIWQDVFAADEFNGDELHEVHDYDETTGKDALAGDRPGQHPS